MKKLLYAAAALLYFSACMPDKFETVKVDNLYSLDVPSYMKKTDKFSKTASLQYCDTTSFFSLVALSENIDTLKQSFIKDNIGREYTNGLDGYEKLLIDNIRKKRGDFTTSPLKHETINGLDAITLNFVLEIKAKKIYFKKAFIKGESNYYLITLWVPETKKSIYEKTMDRMIHSFKEL